MKAFNVDDIRKDFPILNREVHGKPLVYLDNGASSEKPKQVIDVIKHYYEFEHANIHRGVHFLSQSATTKYEEARKKIQHWFNAKHDHEIIFTRGTTEAINLVAQSFGRKYIKEGDEVIISTMEHHSNIVPWQMICEERKAILKVVPINDKGEFDFENYQDMLSDRTKMVAVAHVSNTLGTVNPVKKIIENAHAVGAKVLLDGAQACPHLKVDFQALNCDFYALSAHKMYGPTGIGLLYGKEELLNDMPPYMGGGDMIKTVTFEKTTYNELPHKFEAGTPNIAGGIGFGAAIDYLSQLDFELLQQHEHDLLTYGTEELAKIKGIRFIGEANEKAGVISFLIGSIHPYDMGVILDQLGIAVRTGHHCTEPLMNRYNIPGTVRASFGIYNTKEEIDSLIKGVKKAVNMLM